MKGLKEIYGKQLLDRPEWGDYNESDGFLRFVDVVSKKSAQETVKILAANSFYVEGVALGGTETPALCRDAKSDESRSQNLENQTAPSTDMLEGESDMSKRIRQRATIGGQEKYG